MHQHPASDVRRYSGRQDISRLNLDGFNIHFGTTAGYLGSKNKELEGPGTFETKLQAPFVGMYGVVTKGAFFADANLRFDYYNVELNDPSLVLFDQPVSAKGLSLTLGAGYHWALANGWFIEPSAGAILGRTRVDSFSAVGLPPGQLGAGLSGTLETKPIDNAIGRWTLRVGRTFTAGNLALQPFATASFFHEFAGDVESSYTTCQNCVFQPLVGGGAVPVTDTFKSGTTRVGSWGQYSLGVAGQVINTGWLGFVRGDYRNGENIDGWTLNAGLRYQYTPTQPVAGVYTKGPVIAAEPPVTWTGFYLGGFFGGGYGAADVGFTNLTTVNANPGGWLGGGQVGYNYQVGPYVLGVEGDLGATNIAGSETCGGANGLNAFGVPGGFSPFFMTCKSELDWIATAAARIGYNWDRTLIYLKAGAAWTDETVSANCIIGPFNGAPGLFRQCTNPAGALVNYLEGSGGRSGWMVGYGTEYALTSNWSAKAEFKYMDFGSKDYAASDGSRLTSELQVSTVTIGVNYRFAPWAAPVVARY
ncbi:MAG: outer membrane beta-barrel protein [Xanthobacteraceae bacterium]